MVDIWSIFGFFVWWSIFDKIPLASLYLKSKSNPVLQLCVINLAEAELERYIILPHNDDNLKLLVKKVKYTTED